MRKNDSAKGPLSAGKKLLFCGLCGMLLGAVLSGLIWWILPLPGNPSDYCVYGGGGLLLIGLLAMMHGNPHGGGGDRNGLSVNFLVGVAVQEDKATQGRGDNYTRNHIVEWNPTAVFLLPLSLVLLGCGMLPVLLV